MARFGHIAMSVPNPATAAKFYCNAFDMKIVGETASPLTSGLYLSDGTVSLVLQLPLEKESLYYEMEFRDPNGIIFDISHNGWLGATK